MDLVRLNHMKAEHCFSNFLSSDAKGFFWLAPRRIESKFRPILTAWYFIYVDDSGLDMTLHSACLWTKGFRIPSAATADGSIWGFNPTCQASRMRFACCRHHTRGITGQRVEIVNLLLLYLHVQWDERNSPEFRTSFDHPLTKMYVKGGRGRGCNIHCTRVRFYYWGISSIQFSEGGGGSFFWMLEG